MTDGKLHIERHMAYPGINCYLIQGFSPDEMDSILNAKTFEEGREKLAELLDSHENDMNRGNLGTRWLCGYGIYSIRHFGGHLLVDVGDSCD